MKEKHEKTDRDRRSALKFLAGALGIATVSSLPQNWISPTVRAQADQGDMPVALSPPSDLD